MVIDALAGIVGVGMWVDEDIIAVTVLSIFFEFLVSVSYSVDVLSDTVADVLIEALPGVWNGVITGVLLPPGIGSDLLVGVNVNMCAAVMTDLRCVTLASIEVFGC